MSDQALRFIEPLPGQSLPEFLKATEERWNRRIDKEVGNLGGGLEKIIKELESGANPSTHASSSSLLAIQTTTSSLIQSSQSLLEIAHQLKLWVTLSDEAEKKKMVDAEVEWTKAEIGRLRAVVGGLVGEVGKGESGGK